MVSFPCILILSSIPMNIYSIFHYLVYNQSDSTFEYWMLRHVKLQYLGKIVDILILSEMFIPNVFLKQENRIKELNSIMMQHLTEIGYKRSKCQKLLLLCSLSDEISTPAGLSVSVTMQRNPATVLTGRLLGLPFLSKDPFAVGLSPVRI